MNYDVWYQHCADLMTNEENVSAAQALRGFWHMCADLDIITRDSAEAIAAGHKVMDVFCLAQKTGVYQCFDEDHVQSFVPARRRRGRAALDEARSNLRTGPKLEHEGEFVRLCCGVVQKKKKRNAAAPREREGTTVNSPGNAAFSIYKLVYIERGTCQLLLRC